MIGDHRPIFVLGSFCLMRFFYRNAGFCHEKLGGSCNCPLQVPGAVVRLGAWSPMLGMTHLLMKQKELQQETIGAIQEPRVRSLLDTNY